MTLKGETDIRWSTQIETICKRFRAALRSGETLDSFDHLLRQVPEDVRPQLHEELVRCQSSVRPDSIDTQVLSSSAMANRVFPSELFPAETLSSETAVRGCPTFQGLAAEAIADLEAALRPMSFARGTVLLEQGAQAKGLLVLLSGNVDITDMRTGERIACDGAGSVLGEMSLLTGQPCSAQVVATSDVEALVLSIDEYEPLRETHPELEIALSQLVSDRLGGRRHDALCGKQIGEYRLLHCINRGGMGVVYKAKHIESRETVALKMLRHRFIYDDQMRDRFDQEASVLAGLRHPNIISFREHFLAYRTRFLVLDLCDGADLYCLIHQKWPLSEPTIRAILGQIASGLLYAHQSGVVHRDLKPGNVLVDRQGLIKITDFGLSKLLQSETRDFKVVGTPSYMPPEQFRSERVGPYCDWYAFGCLACEILTGELLFEGDGWVEIFDAKRRSVPSDQWPPIEASDELKRVITGALQPTVAKRNLDLETVSRWAEPVRELFD